MPAASALEKLSCRLHALLDVEAIETLKARYWRALDRKNPAEVEACLRAEAVIDFEGLPRFDTREAFMVVVRDAAQNVRAYNMHHGQNPRIELTCENTAQGSWDIFFYGIDLAAGTLLQMSGAYFDTYVRQNGSWLISTTTMRITSLLLQTTSPTLRTKTLGRPIMSSRLHGPIES